MTVNWRNLILLIVVVAILVIVGVMLSGYGDCCDLGR